MHFCTDASSAAGLSADPADPRIAEEISKYAGKIAKCGEYLDVADAELFAQEHQKYLAIIFDTREDLEPVPAMRILDSRMPASLGLEGPEEIHRESPKQWCLLSTNALYDPESLRNHWLPCFFREGMNKATWDTLRSQIESDTRQELQDIEAWIVQLSNQKPQKKKKKTTEEFDLKERQKQSLFLQAVSFHEP